jgi:hypothetical protein
LVETSVQCTVRGAIGVFVKLRIRRGLNASLESVERIDKEVN